MQVFFETNRGISDIASSNDDALMIEKSRNKRRNVAYWPSLSDLERAIEAANTLGVQIDSPILSALTKLANEAKDTLQYCRSSNSFSHDRSDIIRVYDKVNELLSRIDFSADYGVARLKSFKLASDKKIEIERNALVSTDPKSTGNNDQEMSISNAAAPAVFCICREVYDGSPMICCDACDNWFHYKCVGIRNQKHFDSIMVVTVEKSLTNELEGGNGKERDMQVDNVNLLGEIVSEDLHTHVHPAEELTHSFAA